MKSICFKYCKNFITPVLIIGFFLIPIFAKVDSNVCSKLGYTIETINGIFTDDTHAKQNKDALAYYFGPTYNNEPLTVDYLLNPSHLAGLGDLFKAAYQKYFDSEIIDDYDLKEMLNDASSKVFTQKLLLVGHSQGNFYANSFYDTVADKTGGVPVQSIGVYGVASPASRVAGYGKYITSSTDTVIEKLRWKGILSIMPANEDIKLSQGDTSDGHSFSDVYLKYRGTQIVSDIQDSLNKLKTSDIQNTQKPCITLPELTVGHKIAKVVFTVADPVAVVTKTAIVYTVSAPYKIGVAVRDFTGEIASKIGNALASLGNKNKATVILATDQGTNSAIAETVTKNSPPKIESKPAEVRLPPVFKTPTPEAPNTNQTNQDIKTEIIPLPIVIVTTPPNEDKQPEQITTNDISEPTLIDLSEVAVAVLKKYPRSARTPIDVTPPVITVTGANPVTIAALATYIDLGATATDAVDPAPTIVTTGTANTSIVGTYTITYTATDLANNVSTATRTVNVTDTVAPVITVLGSSSLTVLLDGPVYNDPNPAATAIDAVDGVITPVRTGSVNTTLAGLYTLTYTATDLSNNVSTATRTVRVDTGAQLNRPNSVFVLGNYAYVVSTDGNSFEIIDITNPATPVHKSFLVHNNDTIQLFSPKSVFVVGNYAYVVSASNNLQIIDISNPLAPVMKGTIDTPLNFANPVSIVVSGNYAYVAVRGSLTMNIIDISNPDSPVQKSSFFDGALSLPASVFVSGNYAYLVSTGNTLKIINISNPLLPVQVGQLNDGDGGASIKNPQSVYISGNYAYVTSFGDNTLEIINIINPLAPVHIGKISNGGGATLLSPTSVFVSGDYAYVTAFNDNALEVVNISNPANPTHAGTLGDGVGGAVLSSPKSVFVSGNYAYVASYISNALEIVNISDPASPVHAGKILNGGF